MVLSSHGLQISEAELRALTDCTVFGTDALKAVDAARHLGFPGTAKYNLSLDELRTVVNDGAYPIVFVNLNPINGVDESHALIVLEFSASSLLVCDPEAGQRTLVLQAFAAAWALRRNLTILVGKNV
jgi:ABC-type bacteriocin/lantibiotic exporter with double-glycine peptidase domain